jgi:hypothetical protein
MTPSMATFLHAADVPALRETGRILLGLAALLAAAGRLDDAEVAAQDGVELLEHAARVARRGAGH